MRRDNEQKTAASGKVGILVFAVALLLVARRAKL